MRGRLMPFKLVPSASGITASKYQVRDRLDSNEINLPMMDVADHPCQDKRRLHTPHGVEGSFGTRKRVT